jgi:hypothetical protein
MKEAYYFSHDSNARNDEKIIALRIKYEWKGYGLFWAIIEKLRDSTNYMCIKDYNLVAFDLRVDASLIKSIVEDFGLFVFTECGKYFYSERLQQSMEFKESKSKKAAENASKRWEKSVNDANAMQTQCDGNADVKIGNAIKEKKRKENIVKESKGLAPTRTKDEILKFEAFEKWLNKNTPRVQKMQRPLTIEDYFNLKEKLNANVVQELLMSMENYGPLLKKNVSAYLTVLKWSKNDFNKQIEPKSNTENADPETLKKLGLIE